MKKKLNVYKHRYIFFAASAAVFSNFICSLQKFTGVLILCGRHKNVHAVTAHAQNEHPEIARAGIFPDAPRLARGDEKRAA